MMLEDELIKAEFKKAFHAARKILRTKREPLSCEIHDYFSSEDGHNCIGCNLAGTENHILNFLRRYRSYNNIEESYSQFIMLCYLMVERVYEIFKIVELPESYRLQHFHTFNNIKRWANFIKHPKAFLLVHHPWYVLENDNDRSKLHKETTKIDSSFIQKYYSGEKNNRELYNRLTNKTDVCVVMPEIEKLTISFCNEFRHFVNLIRDNSVYRHILNDKATYEYFYSMEDEEEDNNNN